MMHLEDDVVVIYKNEQELRRQLYIMEYVSSKKYNFWIKVKKTVGTGLQQ